MSTNRLWMSRIPESDLQVFHEGLRMLQAERNGVVRRVAAELADACFAEICHRGKARSHVRPTVVALDDIAEWRQVDGEWQVRLVPRCDDHFREPAPIDDDGMIKTGYPKSDEVEHPSESEIGRIPEPLLQACVCGHTTRWHRDNGNGPCEATVYAPKEPKTGRLDKIGMCSCKAFRDSRSVAGFSETEDANDLW